MAEMPGMKKPELQALPQIGDRLTFLYLEHCQINREDSAILLRDEKGTVRIPAASISVLLLGPGTNVTHRAVELIGDAGVSIMWIGEQGVRFYAMGRPLTHRSHLLMRQAQLVSNQRTHLQVVRKMYQMRFPDEDVSELTMQQLRGREGSRMRKLYKEQAKKWNVSWQSREYKTEDFFASDLINQALSAANVCLYGLAHAVIAALGCSAGLGFVHVGHECSFVYDIADLYKAEITIPVAFQTASEQPEDLPAVVRRRVRDKMTQSSLLERMVKDVHQLLQADEQKDEVAVDVVYLWDLHNQNLPNGRNYAMQEEIT